MISYCMLFVLGFNLCDKHRKVSLGWSQAECFCIEETLQAKESMGGSAVE